jgi:hypothetical protein
LKHGLKLFIDADDIDVNKLPPLPLKTITISNLEKHADVVARALYRQFGI